MSEASRTAKLNIKWNSDAWVALYRRFVREGWSDRLMFIQENLPVPPRGPQQVVIMKDSLVRFRANYAMLLGMVSILMGVPPDELTPLHMIVALDQAMNSGRLEDEP